MRIEQRIWQPDIGWRVQASDGPITPALVLFFAAPGTVDDGARFAELKHRYPGATILGCTTGGEIADADVLDGAIAATAIEFARTTLAFAEAAIEVGGDSHAAGQRLGAGLPPAGLRGVFVLSDGTRINGSDLVAGIQVALGADVKVTGGLAADGARFASTPIRRPAGSRRSASMARESTWEPAALAAGTRSGPSGSSRAPAATCSMSSTTSRRSSSIASISDPRLTICRRARCSVRCASIRPAGPKPRWCARSSVSIRLAA